MSRSSTKGELRVLALGITYFLWIQRILQELHLTLHITPTVYYGNVSANYLAKHHILHARTKHTEVDFHFIKEKLLIGILSVEYIPNKE